MKREGVWLTEELVGTEWRPDLYGEIHTSRERATAYAVMLRDNRHYRRVRVKRYIPAPPKKRKARK